MPAPIIDIILEDPSRDDLHGIVATLDAYNEAHAGMADLPGFAVLLRDAETGTTIGGLYAADGYGWAFIRYLAVPDEYRGQGLGRRLIEEAEKIARVGLWLDIFEFQARPFMRSSVSWCSVSLRAAKARLRAIS